MERPFWKGYLLERGRYVALEEKKIQRVRPESTHTINLTQSVDASSIDPILIDQRRIFLRPMASLQARLLPSFAKP